MEKIRNKVVSYYPKKRVLLLESLLLIGAPLVLVRYFPQLVLVRHALLVLGVIYLFMITKLYGVDWDELGLTSKNLLEALNDSWKLTTIVGAFILVMATYRADYFSFPEMEMDPYSSAWLRILLYVLISVPLQELIFRGFLIKRLSLVSQNSMFIVVYSSIIFSVAHLFFANYWLALGTFFTSLWWSWLFLKHRNVWPVIVSHGLLGGMVFAVTFGMLR